MQSRAISADPWHGKPYYSLDAWCKNTCGHKLYKAALDIGCTCPNRDGSLGRDGCVFCSAGGSGDFAASRLLSVPEQLNQARQLLSSKWKIPAGLPCLIAYFQAYTNTYGDPVRLLSQYRQALALPETAGISIATRPDCLSEPILDGLERLREEFPDKFIWLELGLQTIHDRTGELIGRGYPSSVFEDSALRLHKRSLPFIVHLILGLPGEDRSDVLETIAAVNAAAPFGVKLQLLHILKGTTLAGWYERGLISPLEEDAYIRLVADCIASLSPDICIHRLTGDGPRSLLLAPLWSLRKREVFNRLHAYMKQQNLRHGGNYDPGTAHPLQADRPLPAQ
ncbi:MAG: TIGR01212 family radical SAM protein [Eubacteriales bacterium]|nr:TIGR01212 family radical SAM protein [Eubacteriales bacterium]